MKKIVILITKINQHFNVRFSTFLFFFEITKRTYRITEMYFINILNYYEISKNVNFITKFSKFAVK